MGTITDLFLGTTPQPEPETLTPQQERVILTHLRQGCPAEYFTLSLFGTVSCGTCGQKA